MSKTVFLGNLTRLRRYAGGADRKAGGEQVQKGVSTGERCGLCSVALPPEHRHLLEMQARRVVCACAGCSLLFEGVTEGRFKLIPRSPRILRGFSFAEELWESFALPINLVFFYRNTKMQRVVALYPSPAGAVESLLPLESWATLVDLNPELGEMRDDVEALLVNRQGAGEGEAFLAPMDRCYALVGLMRVHWRGLHGGKELWQQVEAYFRELRRSVPVM